MVPNPATQHVAINYVADGAVSSYLMVTSISTSVSNNYILNINDTNTTLDISTYSVGLYSVALVCDGAVVDSKTLAKQ